MPVNRFLARLLSDMGGSPERAALAAIWRDWPDVVGPELASLAMPLGYHKDTLLLGVEDSMLLQEAHLAGPDFVAAVNARVGRPLFAHVRASLLHQKKPPLPPGAERRKSSVHLPAQGASVAPPDERVDRVPVSGKHLEEMDATSPVARCYAAFVRKSAS